MNKTKIAYAAMKLICNSVDAVMSCVGNDDFEDACVDGLDYLSGVCDLFKAIDEMPEKKQEGSNGWKKNVYTKNHRERRFLGYAIIFPSIVFSFMHEC